MREPCATEKVVLVVEDEPLIRLDAVSIVSDAGYATLEAANAADALRLFNDSEAVHAVFTDIDMPGYLDGLALAHRIRSKNAKVVIIITSGKQTVDDSELPLNATFVPKPYSPEKITRLLESEMIQ